MSNIGTATKSVYATLVAAVLAACAPSTEEVAQQVQKSMQETLAANADFAPLQLQVLKVTVIGEGGSKYQGMATIRTKKGQERQVPVQVTADRSGAIWKTEAGAFLFAAQEEAQSGASEEARQLACFNRKVAAFHEENGEDSPIHHDVMEEWQNECASGK